MKMEIMLVLMLRYEMGNDGTWQWDFREMSMNILLSMRNVDVSDRKFCNLYVKGSDRSFMAQTEMFFNKKWRFQHPHMVTKIIIPSE